MCAAGALTAGELERRRRHLVRVVVDEPAAALDDAPDVVALVVLREERDVRRRFHVRTSQDRQAGSIVLRRGDGDKFAGRRNPHRAEDIVFQEWFERGCSGRVLDLLGCVGTGKWRLGVVFRSAIGGLPV